MALEELDLHLHYRPGKANSQADALSRNAVSVADDIVMPWTVLAPIEARVPLAKDGEETLSSRQLVDQNIADIIRFLEEGILPDNERKAKEITLARSQYENIDGVLYHIEPDKTLWIVLPTAERSKVFNEVHSSVYGAHL